MLEAPEACVIARQMNDSLSGKEIVLAVAGHTPHKFAFFTGDTASYEPILAGRRIDRVRHYGGMVAIEAGDASLVFSDGVRLSYLPVGEPVPAKHQFLMGLSDETALVVTIRMYGGVLLYTGHPQGALADYFEAARTRPQVMSDEFTQEYFLMLARSAADAKKTAKGFLATGQTIPGVGNGVLQDILYNASINPKSRVARLTDAQLEVLYRALRTTLQDMEAAGGRATESDFFGCKGRYVPLLSKDTEGGSCPRCGGTIVKESYLGGSIYYCTGCQPVLV